jgi:methyl-accepting chemotaxis protein
MFPRFFEAQVAQRLAVWGGLLGFLVALYAAVEIIHVSKMTSLGREIERLGASVAAHATADAAFARLAVLAPHEQDRNLVAADAALVQESLNKEAELSGDPGAHKMAANAALPLNLIKNTNGQSVDHGMAITILGQKRSALGLAVANAIDNVRVQHEAFLAIDRKNKTLIVLLALFVIGQIVLLEYRWLVKPMVRMAGVLRRGEGSSQALNADAFRRDEIGSLARALSMHFSLVSRDKQAASAERDHLAGRLARQDEIKRESIAFQEQIAGVVRLLEDHAGRMSAASQNLVAISSDADSHAASSASKTQRVSENVDVVASSIGDISKTLASVAEDAERTSEVAAAARQLVQSAAEDAAALTEAARTIEQVIALIHEVANQTNLLALNATIEAARAGEMGRGFAVVAAEVKQLATRTSRATEEIRGGLQGITSSSTRIAERVARLVASIEEVDTFAASIAGSMRKQDANSQAITSNTAKTAEDVRNFADTFQHVAGLVGDARQAAELVTKVSSDLGRQARDLRAAVERFVAATQRIAA